MVLCVIVVTLSSCSTAASFRHGIDGNYHVLLGSPSAVDEVCRRVGVNAPSEIAVKGCWLKAGAAHFIWAAEDLALQDTLAHEIRHTHEGQFH